MSDKTLPLLSNEQWFVLANMVNDRQLKMIHVLKRCHRKSIPVRQKWHKIGGCNLRIEEYRAFRDSIKLFGCQDCVKTCKICEKKAIWAEDSTIQFLNQNLYVCQKCMKQMHDIVEMNKKK